MGKLCVGFFSDMFTEINGTANGVRNMAYALADYGHDVHVFSPGDFRIEHKNLTHHKCGGFHMSLNPETYFNLPWYKYITFRKFKFLDVLHSHTPLSTGGGLSLHLASNLGIPVVATHNSPLVYYVPQFIPLIGPILAPGMWPLEALIYSRMDLVHTPTFSKKQLLLQHMFKDPIITFTNGIENVWFTKVNGQEIRERFHLEDKKIVLAAGRLAPEKNLPFVMRAFKLVKRQVPNAHLAIVGAGHILKELKVEIKRLGLEDCTTITGMVSREDMMKWYSAGDVTVLYSWVEALGLVLLEAMAQGTPNIGYNGTGIKDVIKDGKTGFLVNNGHEFVQRIVQVLQDDALRKELGKNARQEAEMHRLSFVAKTWTAWYEFMMDITPMIVAKTDRWRREKVIRSFVPFTPGVQY